MESHKSGKIVGCKRTESGDIFVATEKQVFHVCIEKESRDAWQLYLNEKQFAEALRFAEHNWQKQKILRCQADDLFDKGYFPEAAKIYTQLNDVMDENEYKTQGGDNTSGGGGNGGGDVSFEEIALKFLESGATNALMTFLYEKLKRINKKEKTQRLILGAWLTELHLSQMDEKESNPDDFAMAVETFEEFLRFFFVFFGFFWFFIIFFFFVFFLVFFGHTHTHTRTQKANK